MKIAQIQQNRYQYTKPSFTSNAREVKNIIGEVTNRNSTKFFRIDFPWDSFTEHLIRKYANQDKVNIYNYACADGSEAFSLAMMLISKLGREKAQKFFPIIAKDIDNTFLPQARSGIVKLDAYDIPEISTYTKAPISRFITPDYKFENIHNMRLCTGAINEELISAVGFERANILNDIENIESDNSLVMFRNAWEYLSEDERKQLAEKLAKKLGNNSMLVLSDWDISESIKHSDLIRSGLAPDDFANCYKNGSLSS